MQKKITTIIIIAIIIITALTIKNYAVASTNVQLEVPTSGNSGDEITVIVKTNGSAEGLTGIQGTFNYDKDQLEYVSNTIIKDGWFVSGFNEETGIFLLEVYDITDESSFIYEETEVASFTFKVKDNATPENTVIGLEGIVAPGAEQVENTETNETVAINGGSSSNSNVTTIANQDNENQASGTYNTQNSTSNNQAQSNSISTTYVGKNGETRMPDTGIKNIITAFIMGIFLIGLVSGIGYRKYKDI